MTAAAAIRRSPLLFCCGALSLLASAFYSADALQLKANDVPIAADDNVETTYPCEDGCAGSFKYKVDRPVKIVLWTSNVLFFKQYIGRHAPNCTIVRAYQGDGAEESDESDGHSTVVKDPDYDLSSADVVVFNIAVLEQHRILPSSKPEGQLWVAGCWEPEEFGEGAGGNPDGGGHDLDCSLLRDEALMSQMDATATYSSESTYPAFFTPPTEEQLRRAAPIFDSGPIAACTVSDCRSSGRGDWLSEMSSALACNAAGEDESQPCFPDREEVSFYGTCLHNREERACTKDDPQALRMAKKDDLQDVFIKFANRCSARPFALVAENSKTPGYVTEKIWNALATGSVPVYWGPPEAKSLVPPGSSLFASDYASAWELADAMLKFGEAEHRRAREWKSLPVQQWGSWTTARRLSRSTLLPRLCEAAIARSEI